jgi:hypothetical protein
LDVPEEAILKNLTTVFLYVIAALVVIYIGDYVSVRYGIPHNRPQMGFVTIHQYYAVPQKNRSTEYMAAQPFVQTCVHSLFPHFGDPPCWYLNRHTKQVINVGGMPRSPY